MEGCRSGEYWRRCLLKVDSLPLMRSAQSLGRKVSPDSVIPSMMIFGFLSVMMPNHFLVLLIASWSYYSTFGSDSSLEE